MPARAKTLRALEIPLHFSDPLTESPYTLPRSPPRHGSVSLAYTLTCFLALNRMFSCPFACSSALIVLHLGFNRLQLSPIHVILTTICLVRATLARHFYFFGYLPALRSKLT